MRAHLTLQVGVTAVIHQEFNGLPVCIASAGVVQRGLSFHCSIIHIHSSEKEMHQRKIFLFRTLQLLRLGKKKKEKKKKEKKKKKGTRERKKKKGMR